jgi:hypothetical protein
MMDPRQPQFAIALLPPPTLKSLLFSLHYAYPAIIFAYYMTASSVAVCTLQTKSASSSHVRFRLILSLLLLAVSTYLIQLLTLLFRSFINRAIIFSQDTVIGLLSCILVYGLESVGLADSAKPVWYPYIGSLWVAIVVEPVIDTLSVLTRTSEHLTPVEFLDISAATTRYLSFAAILAIYYGLPCSSTRERSSEAERQTLLPKEDGQLRPSQPLQTQGQDTNGYGSVSANSSDTSQNSDSPESEWERHNREAKEQMEKRLAEKGNWFAYVKSFLVIFLSSAAQ